MTDKTMKAAVEHSSFYVSCVFCDNTFESSKPFTKYCKSCAPNPQAWSDLFHYGLTSGQLEQLLQAQNHACALCKRLFTELIPHRNKTRTFVIDHDHKTNKVRGLLCNECNITLGHFEKKPTFWLTTALSYIGKAVA